MKNNKKFQPVRIKISSYTDIYVLMNSFTINQFLYSFSSIFKPHFLLIQMYLLNHLIFFFLFETFCSAIHYIWSEKIKFTPIHLNFFLLHMLREF